MKNPITAIKDFNESRKKKKAEEITANRMKEILFIFETLDKFRDCELISIDYQRHNIYMALSLASQFIEDENNWSVFLENVHNWATYYFTTSEVNMKYAKAKADAEASALRENEHLSPSERNVIRMQASENMDEYLAAHPIAEPDFTIYVIGMASEEPILAAKKIKGVFETTAIQNL